MIARFAIRRPAHLLRFATLVAMVAMAAISGCAIPPSSLTPNSPCGPMIVERIYFGMSYAAGTVGEAEWRTFVARTITPRFPDGLTIYEATGQWRDAKGQIVREPTRVVEVLHPEGADPSRWLAEIAAAYKRDYGQESVLVVRLRGEACF